MISLALVLFVQQGLIHTSDLSRLRPAGEVQISPDGSKIAYSVERRDRPGRRWTELFVMTVASGASVRLGEGISTVRWSPDSRTIAYFSRDSLRVAAADGGNAVAL